MYNIKGFKDERIRAVYSAEFKSTTNFEKDECGLYNIDTNIREARLASRIYIPQDENYEINIPIILNDNNNGCNYQLAGLELDLRRVSGDEVDFYYSRFMLLLDRPENSLITYGGYKSNQAKGDFSDMPTAFITDKKYFRIAPDTSFLCRTIWREWDTDSEDDKSGSFQCAMQINSGNTDFDPLNRLGTYVTNPQFGVDEITSSNLTINIIADDDGSIAFYGDGTGEHPDRFREYIPPKKSIF
jgi:hypothetical protein